MAMQPTTTRQLDAYQRACHALDDLPEVEAQTRARRRTGKKVGEGRPRRRHDNEATAMAARANATNREYVRRVLRLLQDDPRLFAAVASGKLTYTAARKQADETSPLDPVGNVAERLKTVEWRIELRYQIPLRQVIATASVHYQMPSQKTRRRGDKTYPRQALNLHRSWSFDLGALATPKEVAEALASQLSQVLTYEGCPTKTRSWPTGDRLD